MEPTNRPDVTHNAENDRGVAYEMIRERDHYRSVAHEAVRRIEREAGKIHGPLGNVTHVTLDFDVWRSIRALLQSEPRAQTDPMHAHIWEAKAEFGTYYCRCGATTATRGATCVPSPEVGQS